MQVASCTLTVEADPNVLVCSCVLKGTVSEEELRALSVGMEFKKQQQQQQQQLCFQSIHDLLTKIDVSKSRENSRGRFQF